MAKTFVRAFVQIAGVAFGASATVLCGERRLTALVVEVVGFLLPLCALTFFLGNKREDRRRLFLLAVSGAWLGNRLSCALSLVILQKGHIPAWFSLILMSAALVAAWASSGEAPVTEPLEGAACIELRWEDALEKVPGYENLSRREREVLELTLAGKSGREIADALRIAPSTVGSYRARTYEKLGVASKREVLSSVSLLFSDKKSGPDNEGSFPDKTVTPSALFILLSCVICSIVGRSIYRPFLVLAVVLVTSVICCIAAWPADVRRVDAAACLSGASAGFALCAALYSNWVVAPLVAGALIVAGSFSVHWPNWGHLLLTASCASLFIPGLGFAGNLVDSPVSMLLLAGFLFVVAGLVGNTLKQKGEAQALELVLVGERRAMAYLEGRGLSELKAKIVLLTVCGFDSASIADGLYVSMSTVSNYRSGAYKALSVSNREELASLLRRDAGYEGFLVEGAKCNEARTP